MEPGNLSMTSMRNVAVYLRVSDRKKIILPNISCKRKNSVNDIFANDISELFCSMDNIYCIV